MCKRGSYRRGSLLLLAAALLAGVGCAVNRAAPAGPLKRAPALKNPRTGPEVINKVKMAITPAEQAQLLQLARDAVGPGPMEIDQVIIFMSFHPLDIPVALVKMKRQMGPHRFKLLNVRCLHREWSRGHPGWSVCLETGSLTRGPWCTSPRGIRPSEALRVDWRGEELMISVEGNLELEELRSLLRRIEKRDFSGRLGAPIVAAPEIWRVRKSSEGGKVTYEVHASSTAYSSAVLVLVEEQGKLRLVEGYSTLS